MSLGEAGEVGGPALQAALPVIKDTKKLAAQLKPVARQLGDVLVDFQREDGIQRFLDYIFFQGTAVNGFDSFGHYLRAGLIVNQCTTYATEPTGGCSANFRPAASSSAVAARRAPACRSTRRSSGCGASSPARTSTRSARRPRRTTRRARAAPATGDGARDGGGDAAAAARAAAAQQPDGRRPTPRPAPASS